MSDDLLAAAPTPITLKDQISCIERELKYRRHVYPRLVYTGKMSQGSADRELAVMNEVLATLNYLQGTAHGQPRTS